LELLREYADLVPIFDRKELREALIRIPADITDCESGPKMQTFMTNRKRAIKAG